MDKNIADILLEARDYIAQGWCQGRSAINVHGETTVAWSSLAVGWCFQGAIERATGQYLSWDNYSGQKAFEVLCCVLSVHPAVYTLDPLATAVGWQDMPVANAVGWQDMPGRTQQEVLDVLERAVRLAKDEERGGV